MRFAKGRFVVVKIRIGLSRQEYDAAKKEAEHLGIPLDELLRRALIATLPADDSKPWMRFAGMVKSGNADSSRCHDDTVYGHE